MTEFKKSLLILASVRDHLCPTLGFANYYASPVPFFYSKRASIAVFIGRGEVVDSDGAYQIWSPHLVSVFDSLSGEFVLLSAFAGKSGSDEGELCQSLAPVAKLAPEYLNLQIRYCQTVDQITAAMIGGQPYQDQVAALKSQFAEVEPAPLIPFLKSVLRAELRL